jgi:hypothetical protein
LVNDGRCTMRSIRLKASAVAQIEV